MNERIRELAEQAREWAEVSYKKQNDQFTSHWDNPIGYTPTQFFEQKFAELIVRECVNVCKQIGDSHISDLDGSPEFGSGAYFSAKRITQHFGVE